MAHSAALDHVCKLYTELQPDGVELTIDQLRENYEAVCAHADAPADMVVEPVDAGGVPALWVRTPGTSTDRTVVWFHSGGYLIGSARGYAPMGYAVSRAADARVLLVDYRLAPEHPFPAPVRDAVAASRWAIEQAGAGSCVIAGDSAGGGLTMATLVSLRDDGGPLPAAAVCLSGLLDLASTGESIDTNAPVDPVGGRETFDMIAQAYLQGACAPTDPLASPLYAELAGLPPLLLMVGTRDVLQDDSVRMAQRYREAGNEARLVVEEGMVHIWPLFHRILPEGQAGVDTIGAWVRAHT